MDLGGLLGGGIDTERIGRAVNFVIDNQDDVGRMVAHFKDLPDGAMALLHQLPELLHTVGTGLAEAGEQAAHAAAALVGPDGGGGARRALAGGADIMGHTREQLASAAGMLTGVAGQLHDIAIPSVAPKFTSIAGMDVISGLDIGSERLLAGPAQQLTEGAATVTGVAGNLDLLSGSLREISDILGSVGAALEGLGEKLSDSGQRVAGLLEQNHA